MENDEREDGQGMSRRTLLALFGAGAVVSAEMFARHTGSALAVQQDGAAARGPLETLTAAEAATLDAMAARLIPSDENGPGAIEAGATRYIDRALGGALSASREVYRNGLAALDAFARSAKGAPFAQLSAVDQDAVLRDLEANRATTGFSPPADAFFNLVRAHVIQGTFSDPYYGGNINFVGWDLLGYPGIRLGVGADDQRLDRRATPVRRSAYEHAMFSKKPPSRAALTTTDPWPLS